MVGQTLLNSYFVRAGAPSLAEDKTRPAASEHTVNCNLRYRRGAAASSQHGGRSAGQVDGWKREFAGRPRSAPRRPWSNLVCGGLCP